MKRQLGNMIERLVKAAVSSPAQSDAVAAVEADVLMEIRTLRSRLAELSGSLVSTRDGLLVAHDLPTAIEPTGMAALTASELALSHRIALTSHEGAFHEVVICSGGGYVVIYSAGPYACLTVLTGPDVNVGRLHLESRPVARRVADHLAAASGGPQRPADV